MVYAADLGSVATSVEVRILSKAFSYVDRARLRPRERDGEIRPSRLRSA